MVRVSSHTEAFEATLEILSAAKNVEMVEQDVRELLRIQATEAEQEKKQDADAVDVGSNESIKQQKNKTKVHPSDHRIQLHISQNANTTTRHHRKENILPPEYWTPEYPWLTKDFYNEKGEVDERSTSLTTFEDIPARLFFHVITIMWRRNISTLFEAILRMTGERVVLKITAKAQHSKRRRFILTEQRVMALGKNNACLFMASYHSSFQTENHCFLVMEFMGGERLNRILDKVGCISESAATFYIAEIALGVFFLHQNRVILRALSTSDVVVGEDGHLRLYDFSSSADNVAPGEFIGGLGGSVHSSAPEMLFDTLFNKAVDYWGIGVILYTMVSGKLPFSGTTRAKLFQSISYEHETYNSALSEGTVDLCKNLLAKDQKCRLGYNSDAEEQFKRHPFFDNLSWRKMEMQMYSPPFIPNYEDYEVLTASWDFTADQEMMVKKKVVKAYKKLSESSSVPKLKQDIPRRTLASKVSAEASLSLNDLDKKRSLSKPPEVFLSYHASNMGLTPLDGHWETGECSSSLEKSHERARSSLAIPSLLETSSSLSAQYSHISELSTEIQSAGQPDSKRASQVHPSADAILSRDSGHRSLSHKRLRTTEGLHSSSLSSSKWHKSMQLSKRRRQKSFLCRCKPCHWKQRFQSCWDSFLACLEENKVTCRAVCCGPEDIDYKALANEQPGRLSQSTPKPQIVSSDCSSPYAVDVFGEINTADTQDSSKPGEWIGLGSQKQSRPQDVKAEQKPSTSALESVPAEARDHGNNDLKRVFD